MLSRGPTTGRVRARRSPVGSARKWRRNLPEGRRPTVPPSQVNGERTGQGGDHGTITLSKRRRALTRGAAFVRPPVTPLSYGAPTAAPPAGQGDAGYDSGRTHHVDGRRALPLRSLPGLPPRGITTQRDSCSSARLDPRNGAFARLILAMTSIMLAGTSEESIANATELLEQRPGVRTSLSPIVVAKYLLSRNSPAKIKKFRQAAAVARCQRIRTRTYGRSERTAEPRIDTSRPQRPE